MVAMGDSSGSSFLLHACILLLLLILTLLQIMFFAFLPEIELHADFCNATVASKTLTAATSPELRTPMHLFYRSLYLSPREIASREKDAREKAERERHAALITDIMKNSPKIRGEKDGAMDAERLTKQETEGEKLDVKKGFFLQAMGQGHDALNSTSTYCINLITPNDSPGVLQDFELYLNALPSSRPVYAFKGHTDLPASVIDLYLERHPIDKKYYRYFNAPHDKTIWMMQNAEFFDRHELANPDVGVMVIKNRIGLKKVLEYRHRHNMGYTVFYTKHTSHDVYQPEIERDWTSFLHLAGWSPFKNTRVILQAWARHPEWPKLVLRVIKADICSWIDETYGPSGEWRLANVDYKCGSEPLDMKNELQNKIGLHLCPSETEGFGHYINEARSAGALILTTNVAPMNELVDEKSGVLVGKAHDWWWQTKGDLFMPLAHVDVEDIEAGVERILLMSVEERKRMGRRARAKYLEDRTYFLNAMAALEESLCQEEVRIDKLAPYLY
ncbi:hypothetical protein Poli38472_010031 [Pythium oligandrum]|uniref:Glycosyl transferase family 1 domain-containing protein n=1 Tax=Pythium oligandrum TaxID=41045 RepID=A0A8K1FG95_PYTOL|nr:hypothetical protein Poli38472_010031 [Pythium oligandrum]|eukprot:TMW58472.1 hypothetical protein Poli38472_010031 [Pythium oligandrum]